MHCFSIKHPLVLRLVRSYHNVDVPRKGLKIEYNLTKKKSKDHLESARRGQYWNRFYTNGCPLKIIWKLRLVK